MLGQVKRLEIDQSSQVTLQELIVWLDEREGKKREPEVTREFSTMYESSGKPVFLS